MATDNLETSEMLVVDPKDGECRLRGFGILNSLSFVHKKEGQPGIERALRRLALADQSTIAKIQRTKWYPFALHCRLLRAIDAELGAGDFTLLFELGGHSAKRDSPIFFRPLMRLGHPGWIIDVATRLWRFFHGEGQWQLERTPQELVAKLCDFQEADAAFCASFMGYVSKMLELSGAEDIQATHMVCKAKGAPNCIFTVRWSAQ
jgi:hypothetical protein